MNKHAIHLKAINEIEVMFWPLLLSTQLRTLSVESF